MNRVARHEAEKAAKARQDLIDQGMSPEHAAEHLAAQERVASAIGWLQGKLFSEEHDYAYDSVADAADRRRGINPMSDEYVQQMNGKRQAFGIPPLSSSGYATGNESHAFCEKLVRGLLGILNAEAQKAGK